MASKQKCCEYYKNNKDKFKEYYILHKKEILEKRKKYYKEHPEKMKKIRNKRKEYTKLYQRNWTRDKRKNDIQFKIKKNLRGRIYDALHGKIKPGSAIKDLGCSLKFFKNYIESLWRKNMSWDNWGKEEENWSIDHIKPLSKIDLTDREQFLMACHYTNLQPMWHIDNMKKGNR